MPFYFTQSCPTCGRGTRIPIHYLGRPVACQHCHGEFVAAAEDDEGSEAISLVPEEDPRVLPRFDSMRRHPLMTRVEALLRDGLTRSPSLVRHAAVHEDLD